MKLLAHFVCYFAVTLLMFSETYCQRSQLDALNPLYRLLRGLTHNLLRNRDESDAYKTNLVAGVSFTC